MKNLFQYGNKKNNKELIYERTHILIQCNHRYRARYVHTHIECTEEHSVASDKNVNLQRSVVELPFCEAASRASDLVGSSLFWLSIERAVPRLP